MLAFFKIKKNGENILLLLLMFCFLFLCCFPDIFAALSILCHGGFSHVDCHAVINASQLPDIEAFS